MIFPDIPESKSGEKVICQWVEGAGESRLRTLGPNKWLALRSEKQDHAAIMKYLPDPGLEWKVIVNHQEEVFGRKTVL